MKPLCSSPYPIFPSNMGRASFRHQLSSHTMTLLSVGKWRSILHYIQYLDQAPKAWKKNLFWKVVSLKQWGPVEQSPEDLEKKEKKKTDPKDVANSVVFFGSSFQNPSWDKPTFSKTLIYFYLRHWHVYQSAYFEVDMRCKTSVVNKSSEYCYNLRPTIP